MCVFLSVRLWATCLGTGNWIWVLYWSSAHSTLWVLNNKRSTPNLCLVTSLCGFEKLIEEEKYSVKVCGKSCLLSCREITRLGFDLLSFHSVSNKMLIVLLSWNFYNSYLTGKILFFHSFGLIIALLKNYFKYLIKMKKYRRPFINELNFKLEVMCTFTSGTSVLRHYSECLSWHYNKNTELEKCLLCTWKK